MNFVRSSLARTMVHKCICEKSENAETTNFWNFLFERNNSMQAMSSTRASMCATVVFIHSPCDYLKSKSTADNGKTLDEMRSHWNLSAFRTNEPEFEFECIHRKYRALFSLISPLLTLSIRDAMDHTFYPLVVQRYSSPYTACVYGAGVRCSMDLATKGG